MSTINKIRISGVTYDLGSSGGGVTSGEVQTMISAATSGYTERFAEDEEVTAAGLNALNDALSGKQDTLIAGTNITISGNVISASGGGGGNNTVELTQAQYDELVSGGTVDPTTYYIITDATPIDVSNYWTSAQTESAITAAVSGKASQSDLLTVSGQVANKQDTLVSGTNIKTINNESILGSGNIDIQGGGSVTIDPSLNSGSTNPVANSAITNAINTVSANSVSDVSGDFVTIDGNNSHILNVFYKNDGNILPNGIFRRYKAPLYVDTNDSNRVGVSGVVETSAVTSAVTSASTDAQIPTAKAVYDAISQGGGGAAASSAITSGDTNAVAGGAVYDKFDEVESVTAAALNNLNDKFGGLKLQQITQSDYDALVSGGTVDSSTLYIITNVV